MEGDPGLQWPAQDDLASVWQGGGETSVPPFSCLRLCPVPCKESTGATKPWWYLGPSRPPHFLGLRASWEGLGSFPRLDRETTVRDA